MQRRQLEGREANPMRQRRAVDAYAVARQDLRLTVKGKMVCVFQDEHVGDERFRRQAALDQPVRGRGLHHAVGAAPAGVFRPPRNDHAQSRRDLVEPLRDVLADDVQSAATTRASLRLGLDDDLLAWQMRRQVTSVGATGFPRFSSDDVTGLLSCGILGAMLRLDVFEGQLDLVLADPLRTTTELRAAQHRDDMIEALGTRGQSLDFGGQRAGLGLGGLRRRKRGEQQGLQALTIARKLIDRQRHAGDSPIWQHVRQPPPQLGRGSLRRCGPCNTACMHARPIQPFEQRRQLRR